MYRIVIVDDEQSEITALSGMVKSFFDRKGELAAINTYRDGLDLIRDYNRCDIIFLDIKMDKLDGMDTARLIRKLDQETIIIFVTHMAQFAIQGYEVQALDFIVKPADQFSVDRVLERALQRLRLLLGKTVLLKTVDRLVSVSTSDIMYIEVYDHDLIYHTVDGDYRVRGKLSDTIDNMSDSRFIMTSRSHVVNLAFVKAVGQDTVTVGVDKVQLSRSNRREFIQLFTKFLGDNR